MHHPSFVSVTPLLDPLLEAVASLVVLVGYALSAAALTSLLRHDPLPALLVAGYVVVPIAAAVLALDLLTSD